jgi:hypothetical protein
MKLSPRERGEDRFGADATKQEGGNPASGGTSPPPLRPAS